ncbi:MAG TPA: alpha/beta hydrolase [Roseiarcus sp.]|nr:alpha/beta hydrolase [Roseiarcus sp.]
MLEFSSAGVRIAYADFPAKGADRGEPILLIHGFASSHIFNWVNPGWVRVLTEAGRRTIALDNRGHGASEKLYDPQAYHSDLMAEDARRLLDELKIERADVMGYSMGARIAAMLAFAHSDRLRSLILGGLGHHLINGVGLPLSIADAMEAASIDDLVDPQQRVFRAFADQTKSDRRALAACIRGSRQTMRAEEVAAIDCPALVAVGSRDPVAGDPKALAALFPKGRALEIPGRDHMLAVGDKVFKAAALAFLEERP